MIESSIPRRLQAIGLSPALAAHARLLGPESPFDGLMRVIEVHRDGLRLHDGEAEHPARALPALIQQLQAADDALAVGDWVQARRNAHGEWWVQARLPPTSQIARRLHDGRDKVTRTVVVSNVDTVLVVMGLDADFSPRRLERYAALVRLAGVGAVVVLTKADLCADVDARIATARRLVPPGVTVLALDARAGDPVALLAPWLAPGQTLVLMGSSGVGKSTLTNALLGHAAQDTGGTRKGDGRGRHTTTTRTLFALPGAACVIDTPGLRTLRLDGEAGAVQGVFDDIATLAPQCRFRNCRHEGEPGCAVQAGVGAERLKSFHKLRREAERDTMSALDRQRQLADWKARGRAARAHLATKRGER